jgi:hypothetical protein
MAGNTHPPNFAYLPFASSMALVAARDIMELSVKKHLG